MPWNFTFPEDEPGISIPAGTFIATIEKVEEKVSKNGNNMIVMHYQFQANGMPLSISDAFVLSESALWKIRNFAKMLGLPYKGQVSYDENQFLNKKIVIEIDKDENGKYMEVKRYSIYSPESGHQSMGSQGHQNQSNQSNEDIEEDLPF